MENMEAATSYDEVAQARVDIWKYIFGFTEMAVVKCAIDLEIPDILESHTAAASAGSGSMTLSELSSVVGCPQSSLHRIMSFLTHHQIFKEVKTDGQDSSIAYAQSPLSRLLMKSSLAPHIQFAGGSELHASVFSLSKFLVQENEYTSAFEAVHGVDIWRYTQANPSFSEVFNKAMTAYGGFILSTVIEEYTAAFKGINCLVDVGGNNGMALRALVKSCPWITRAINFDLPHVVASSNNDNPVEHIGGDMFVAVPSADAAFIMSVLHDWDDDACVKILKNCKDAIPRETGKVIIVDVVMDDDRIDDNLNNGGNNCKYRSAHLALDMVMMSHTIKGKLRKAKEWANILSAAGFAKHTIKYISAPQSVIEAYPS